MQTALRTIATLLILFMASIAANAQYYSPALLAKAQAGDPAAQCNLGVCYANGLGVPQSYEDAISWFYKAAGQGHAMAQFNLGSSFYYGVGVPQDFQKAAEWYQKAADQGNGGAQFNLACLYYTGQGVPQNYKKAAMLFQNVAALGYAEAQFNLGACYDNGEGVPQSYRKAADLYEKAAVQGHVNAQFNLGSCYYKGQGVPQSYEKAAEWYQKAAEQGHAGAQFSLGSLYNEGRGVPQNYQKAIELYQKAADQGYANAQCNLGYCYKKGEGVPQDYKKAAEWYHKAAVQGNAYGQLNIGICYEDGRGVPQNYGLAAAWYKKAADQGDTDAKTFLGKLYKKGFVKPNEINKYIAEIESSAFDSETLPIINIKNIEFVDNGDNIIEAGESCIIAITISNEGNGVARGCTLRSKANVPGISISDIKLPEMYPGMSYTEKVRFTAGHDIATGRAEISVVIDEPHGLGTDPTLLAVDTKAFEAPRVLVSDYSLTGTQGGRLAKKEPFDLQVLVQNLAQGKAEDVVVGIELPQNVYLINGDRSKRLGVLAAGDTREMNYTLLVNNNYSAPTIPVRLTLKEKHGKYAESRTIDLKLNQDLAQNKIDVKARQSEARNDIARASISGKVRQSDVDYDIPKASKERPATFAVAIGNEDYRQHISVPYARNDATVMGSYLTSALGVPESNVRVVKDATRNEIIAQLDWLEQVSKAYKNDIDVVVYYSGHGVPDEATGNAYLIPTDGYSSNTKTCIALDEIYDTLGKLGARNVTVIIDACFSGAERGDGMLMAAKGVALRPKTNSPTTGSMVVMAASQGTETAYPYDEMSHGMFTYFLLKKLQQTGGKVTLGELADYVTEQVSRSSIVVNNKPQTPSVLASPAVASTWRTLR